MMRHPLALAGALATGAIASGCLFPSLSSLAGGDDAGVDDAGRVDGGDAASEAGAPATLANVGASVAAATGDAQQTHIVWAAADQRWWLFYIDGDPTLLKTRSSPDFVTWTDGASLTLPYTNAAEGRNFSVAYASLSGADVVHVSFSHDQSSTQTHTHARAEIQKGAITFGAAADVCSVSASSPGADSPAALLLADGTVWDSTGDVNSQSSGRHNEDVFVASSPDTGPSWTGAFTQKTVEIVTDVVNARQMIQANGVVALWEAGDQEPNPTNVHASVLQGTWGAPISLFPDAVQDPNDWSGAALRVGGSIDLHVVRARLAGGYDHAVGAGATPAAPPPTMARTAGSGLLALADPDHLAVVDTAADGSLQLSTWSPTDGVWSAWRALTGPGVRHYLSGYCPDLSLHPEAGGCAVLWTSPSNAGFQIGGMLVKLG